jgi:hypothetical protein
MVNILLGVLTRETMLTAHLTTQLTGRLFVQAAHCKLTRRCNKHISAKRDTHNTLNI